MSKLQSLIRSRRFWAAIGGILTVAMQDVIGLSETASLEIVGLIAAWIVGDSIMKTDSSNGHTDIQAS